MITQPFDMGAEGSPCVIYAAFFPVPTFGPLYKKTKARAVQTCCVPPIVLCAQCIMVFTQNLYSLDTVTTFSEMVHARTVLAHGLNCSRPLRNPLLGMENLKLLDLVGCRCKQGFLLLCRLFVLCNRLFLLRGQDHGCAFLWCWAG